MDYFWKSTTLHWSFEAISRCNQPKLTYFESKGHRYEHLHGIDVRPISQFGENRREVARFGMAIQDSSLHSLRVL